MYKIQVLSSKPLVSDLIANADLNLYPYRLIGDAVAVHAVASDDLKKSITIDPPLETGTSTEYIEIPTTYINDPNYPNTVRIGFTGTVNYSIGYMTGVNKFGYGRSVTRISVYHVLPDGSDETIEIGTYTSNLSDSDIFDICSVLPRFWNYNGNAFQAYKSTMNTADSISNTIDMSVYPKSKLYLKIENTAAVVAVNAQSTLIDTNISQIDTFTLSCKNVTISADPEW